jgi:hypothetical protein
MGRVQNPFYKLFVPGRVSEHFQEGILHTDTVLEAHSFW